MALTVLLAVGCATTKRLENKLMAYPYKAITPAEAASAGIRFDSNMDKLYPNGMDLQQDNVAQGYLRAWQTFLQEMMADIKAQGLTWDKPYRFSLRTFFAADGTVDLCLYNWNGDEQPSDEWKTLFHTALEAYLNKARYGHSLGQRFSQCGSGILKPKD